MRVFSKVSPQVWESERFRTLDDDGARLAYLYLLSNSHQNSIGCYRLRHAYACADLCWDERKYTAAEQALVAADLVAVDAETREILIQRWFKHNPPTNPKHHLGAVRLVGDIQSATLREAAGAELRAAWEKWQVEHPLPGAGGTVSQALLDATRRRSLPSR